jgi:hypothetical protein
MSTLSLRLPDSLHETARRVASQEHVSLNQLIATAVAEKLSALLTEDYLEGRTARGDRADYQGVLAKVPHARPIPADRLRARKT